MADIYITRFFPSYKIIKKMDLEYTLKQIETASHQAVEYLSERANLEKIGKITAISVATYYVANVKKTTAKEKKSCACISLIFFFFYHYLEII